MTRTYRAQEPVAPYVADEDKAEAKLFANGRSQAIRLPKQFRMPGDRVVIHREGKRLIVEPIEEVERDANGHPQRFWQLIDALQGHEDEWQCPDDPVPTPMEIDEDGDPVYR